MTHTIVHRMGKLVPRCVSLWHNKLPYMPLISGYFFECGIRILNVVSKVMPYPKCPNGSAGGRFMGYAASWWHNSFNLHHFRPYFFPLISVPSNSPKFSFSISIAQLSLFLLSMPKIATDALTRAIQCPTVTLQ